jgi:hypothetical protein
MAALVTFVIGGALNIFAVRMRWIPRFVWPAAIVTPLAVGLFVYWSTPKPAY